MENADTRSCWGTPGCLPPPDPLLPQDGSTAAPPHGAATKLVTNKKAACSSGGYGDIAQSDIKHKDASSYGFGSRGGIA
jgi:hypothetical protein